MPGVTVRLCNPSTACSGADQVAITTTNAQGQYLFNSLDPVSGTFAINTDYVIRVAANTGPLQGTRVQVMFANAGSVRAACAPFIDDDFFFIFFLALVSFSHTASFRVTG